MIDFVAFDSFGIKSMCTKIVTNDVKIVIDPGVAIETNSFPIPLFDRLTLVDRYERKIRESMKNTDITIITHYHYDHHIPEGNLYKGKKLLIKHPEKNINKSQKNRAKYFLDLVRGNEIFYADNNELKFGSTKIRFTKSLWHGTRGTKLGFVVGVIIENKEKIFFTSDIDGPYIEEYADMIVEEKPEILIIDGPATYLLGYIMSYENLKKSIKNLKKIVEKTDFKTMILDHHLLRDYRYRDLLHEVYETGEKLGKNVISAAEYRGRKPAVIDGYVRYGPTKWKEWERHD